LGIEAIPFNDDWIGIQRYFSQIVWSEYFAEGVAYSYLNEKNIDNQIDLAITIMQSCDENIKREIAFYRSHGEIGQVWNYAVGEISKTVNQLSRVLGLLVMESNNARSEAFQSKITAIAPTWLLPINELYDKL
jgi:hypothetical protein